VAHLQGGLFVHCVQIELEFGNVRFEERGKLEYPETEKPLGTRTRTNKKLNSHMSTVI